MVETPLFKDLENYGIIGNLDTCALIGNDGAIDWFCLPRLDSPSVFAALLDTKKGGHFKICPVDKYESFQTYSGKTNVLITFFKTAFGDLKVTDFMPVIKNKNDLEHRAIFRKVESTQNHFRISIEFMPRFNYAQTMPLFKKTEQGMLAESKDVKLFLQSPCPLDIQQDGASKTFELKKQTAVWFILQYNEQYSLTPDACESLLHSTKKYWTGWENKHKLHKEIFQGPLYDIIVRSGLILKLLTNSSTGAIAAAATTSLPEEIGGVRNWDYRFAWIRDASFTSQALFHLGHVQEAKEFIAWIERIIKQDNDPADFLVMYGLINQSTLKERNLNNLSGYKNSAPVRIGNAAFKQKQFDIYGELINAIFDTSRYGKKISKRTWKDITIIIDYVCRIWKKPDSGIWEVRGAPRHFVYSKLMCWVAIDRGVKMATKRRSRLSLTIWQKTRDEIKKSILERGYNKKLNAFVQSYDSHTLDASCLLIPLMEFLPFDDSRVQGTINAIQEKLSIKDTFVRRYESEDGLPGSEGAFLICTFWLIKALLLSGRLEEGKKYFANVLKFISPLGLFAEEIDPETGKQLGNFPQAFSHIGLINCAIYFNITKGKKHKGPKPIAVEEEKGGKR